MSNNNDEIRGLYHFLEEGLEAEKAGRMRPFREVIVDIRKELTDNLTTNH